MDALKGILSKIPFVPITVLIAGYYGYEYWDFYNNPESPLLQERGRHDVLQTEIASLKKKKAEVEEFEKKLAAKQAEIQDLARQLNEMRSSIKDTLDVADFMGTVLTEAKRVGLQVGRLDPGQPKSGEFYVEHPFNLTFKGVYTQVLVFLDRMASIQRLIRVDNLAIKPFSTNPNSTRFVELDGTMELKTYRYALSNVDKLPPGTVKLPAGTPQKPGGQ